MRGVHTAFVAAPCGDDVNRASPLRHTAKYRLPVNLLQVFSDYKWKPKKPTATHETLENSISADYERMKPGRNFRLVAARQCGQHRGEDHQCPRGRGWFDSGRVRQSSIRLRS